MINEKDKASITVLYVKLSSKCTVFAIHRYLLPLVIIGGLLGNALNLRVLARRELRSPTTTFLRAMAAADALVLALQLPHMLALVLINTQLASRVFNVLLALYYPYIRCVPGFWRRSFLRHL